MDNYEKNINANLYSFNIKTINDNFALVLIIAFTGKQSYYNGQYMYLFTQQLNP
jgi:hypothetical protein